MVGESMPDTGIASPGRVDRETTPGRCANLDYCSIGMQRIQVRVPVSQPFICPECASPLRPPTRLAGGSSSVWLTALATLSLLATVAASGTGGYMIGQWHSIPNRAASPVISQPPEVHAAAILPPAAQPPPERKVSAAPVSVTPAPQSIASMPPPIVVTDRPYPAHPPSLEASDPSPRIPQETKSGQVTIDCLLAAALIRPACRVTSVRGTDALSAAAVTWMQRLSVHYTSGPDASDFAAPDHRWRVVIDDFSGPPRRNSPHP